MAKKPMTIRLEESLFEKVTEIGKIIEENTPGAEANFATISRYAIEDYLKRYEDRCNLSSIQADIPVENLNKEELGEILKCFEKITEIISSKEESTPEESKFLRTSHNNIFKVLNYQLNKADDSE